ncbi:MAG: hypothetical protein GY862_35640 [Gammaproteobacteria bacterium]|nr:hypothetical protein [Gammaproteobacteria bacterium]
MKSSRKLLSGVAYAKLAAATLILAGSTAYAASDGALGLTSTGTSDLNLTKGDGVQISQINDITWGPYASTYVAVANEDQTDDVCIYSSAAGGLYDVTLSGVNWFSNQYRLHDGAGAYINYQIRWDQTGANTAISTQTLEDNSGGGYVGDNVNPNCGGLAATNVRILYRITLGNLNAAAVGVYTDTLTMLISPH